MEKKIQCIEMHAIALKGCEQFLLVSGIKEVKSRIYAKKDRAEHFSEKWLTISCSASSRIFVMKESIVRGSHMQEADWILVTFVFFYSAHLTAFSENHRA